MFLKYFSCVLLATAAIQAFPELKHNKSERDLWDDANRVLESVKQNLELMISDSEANLQKSVTELSKKVDLVVAENNQDVKELVDDSLTKISYIKKDAESKGIDIRKCLNGEEQQIMDSQKKFIESERACINGKIDSASRISHAAIAEIRKVMNKYDGMKKKVEACRNSSNQEVCLNTALQDILDELMELTFYVSNLVTEAQTQIENLGKAVEKCVQGKVVFVRAEITKIVDEFSKCVSQLKPQKCT